jgi:hypothetical protein
MATVRNRAYNQQLRLKAERLVIAGEERAEQDR